MNCFARFTTLERVEASTPEILKRDGKLETFDSSKIKSDLLSAFAKRPVPPELIDDLVNDVHDYAVGLEQRTINSTVLGQYIRERLKLIDPIACVRFASVFKAFTTVGDFLSEIDWLRQPSHQSTEAQQLVLFPVAVSPPPGRGRRRVGTRDRPQLPAVPAVPTDRPAVKRARRGRR